MPMFVDAALAVIAGVGGSSPQVSILKHTGIRGRVTNCRLPQCAFPGPYGFGVLRQGTWQHERTLPIIRSSP